MQLPKRRNLKTGLSLEDELKAWRMYFSFGADYFDDLKVVGIPRMKPVPRTVAEEAWSRLGPTFLASWIPTASRQEPWGLTEFGRPE